MSFTFQSPESVWTGEFTVDLSTVHCNLQKGIMNHELSELLFRSQAVRRESVRSNVKGTLTVQFSNF